MQERVRSGDFQAFIWSPDCGPFPLQALRRWHSQTLRAGGNWVAYKNTEFDKLLDTAALERDEAKQMALLRKADAFIREDAPIWAYHPRVHEIKPVANEMMYQDVSRIWVDETSPRAKEK